MEKTLEFRQVILVTDGKSNKGVDPIKVVNENVQKGITFSTIGIIQGYKDEESIKEIKEIANAGNGLWEITDIHNLEKSMCMLTRQTACNTIQQAVNNELKSIIGEELDKIEIQSRRKIIELIEKIEDEMTIKCCVVLDCSKSMTNKIEVAKKSIISLLRNLSMRKGNTYVGVIAYPFGMELDYKVVSEMTNDISGLENRIQSIEIGGLTPTGPALLSAIELLSKDDSKEEKDGLFESMIV
ncbi:VWA domain-containing protein [Clostridiaceae bacterium M8S5]|nr:VWA domain-containing protein [Clostridiaceae bacterium M8S5]